MSKKQQNPIIHNVIFIDFDKKKTTASPFPNSSLPVDKSY